MNLYLIGYRGCGKSSVAPLVAEKLDLDVVDSDQIIQDDAGTSIATIFEEQGEPAFRKLEQNVISRLAKQDHQVVSLGGGAPMFDANREAIMNSGKAVYLSAPAETLWARISGDDVSVTQRPDLTDEGGLAEVRSMLAIRDSVYNACADYTIDTHELTVQEVADRILDWWKTVDKKE